MAETIMDGLGDAYRMKVNADGSINANSTTPLPTSSPNALTQLIYLASGTATGVTGSAIGSIIKFIDAGSYVKVLSYLNNNLVNIGSWV